MLLLLASGAFTKYIDYRALHRFLHPAPDLTEDILGNCPRAISEREQIANIEIVLDF